MCSEGGGKGERGGGKGGGKERHLSRCEGNGGTACEPETRTLSPLADIHQDSPLSLSLLLSPSFFIFITALFPTSVILHPPLVAVAAISRDG